MIGPEHEQPRAGGSSSEGFGDAVTFSFGDPAQRLYGSARLGMVPGEPVLGSALGILFAGAEVAAVGAIGGVELDQAGWERLDVGDVSAEIVEPLRAWRVRYDGDEGGFDLRFDALGPPAEVGEGAIAESAAGLRGYEQRCRVTGAVRHGEQRWTVDCLGQRGHQWGAPDWDRIALARTVSVWLEGGPGVALASVRPQGADGHGAEAVSAYLLEEEQATRIADPLLSTASDAEGRQQRAGLELWVDDDTPPHRIAGEAVCGTTLDLGRLRLDCAFFQWRGEGRRGVGRYDVLRRA